MRIACRTSARPHARAAQIGACAAQVPILASRSDNRGDQARRYCGKDELIALAAPFVAARRGAEMIAAIVDALGTVPVVIAHPLAAVPVMAVALILAPALVLAVIAMIAV